MGKLYIDLNTLTVVRKKFSPWEFIKSSLPYILSSLGISLVIVAFLLTNYKSPVTLKLEEQNKVYLEHFTQLDQKVNILNKELNTLAKNDDNLYRKAFGMDPVPQQWRMAGSGGTVLPSTINRFGKSSVVTHTAYKIDRISQKVKVQAYSYKEIIDLVKNKEKMTASIPAIQPISNKDLIRFGSPFGYRMHPILHRIMMHTGIDLTAHTGTPVYATGDGIVVRADAAARGYGNHIRISHGFGYMTMYAHLSKILVKPGQKVKRGELIGLVGSTGRSTGPHLHYEVRINGKPVNPVNFYYNDMTDEEYKMMIKQAETANTHVY